MKKRLLSILMALALCLTLLPTAALADGTYTVIYTDGVDGEEVFEDQITSDLPVDAQTPAFIGNLKRAGYVFARWSPTVETTVKAGNADESNVITYTATWKDDRNQNGIPDVEEKFTVIFTAGTIGADVWPDQIFEDLSVGDLIPPLTSDPSRPECTFNGWDPFLYGRVEAPTEGNVIVYTARWIRGNYMDPSPLTQVIQINYYDETENKPVAEVNGVVVSFDATYVPAYLISKHLPDGYMVKDGLSNVPLDAGASSVSVSVEKIPTTKVVKISYYNEISQEQVAEAELEVPFDATCVNTSALKAPAGYELAATGDLPIQDGYVHAAVDRKSTRLNSSHTSV